MATLAVGHLAASLDRPRNDGVVVVIALIGCHGAGKTSLAGALSECLGWSAHDEIGARLAGDRRFRSAGMKALDAQAIFDDAVISRELARDAQWPRGVPRIVETWHPGNLAYAASRSPGVVDRHLRLVTRSCRRAYAGVIEVTAPSEVLSRRQRESGPLSYFMTVAEAARERALQLGLPLLATVSTENRTPRQLADSLAPMLLDTMARMKEERR